VSRGDQRQKRHSERRHGKRTQGPPAKAGGLRAPAVGWTRSWYRGKRGPSPKHPDQPESGERITTEHPWAQEVGFTADLFLGWLWRDGKDVYVSYIMAEEKGRGHFSSLLEALWDRGYTVKVPTPLFDMPAILLRKGFVRADESEPLAGQMCEVWVRSPDQGGANVSRV